MNLTDAFLNASMILSGMGPATELKTKAGKVFAGCYAIFSGLIIVIATGFVLAPIFHRVLHKSTSKRATAATDAGATRSTRGRSRHHRNVQRLPGAEQAGAGQAKPEADRRGARLRQDPFRLSGAVAHRRRHDAVRSRRLR